MCNYGYTEQECSFIDADGNCTYNYGDGCFYDSDEENEVKDEK